MADMANIFVEPPLKCGTLTLPSPMGIGTNKWGVNPKKFSETDLAATYNASLEHGVSFFNTAQFYNSGESEEALGRLRTAAGGRGMICSKFNALFTAPEKLVESLRETLKHCQMDKLDAFLIHHPKGDSTVLADQLAIAVKDGLVETVGVSNYGEKELRRFHGMMADRGVPLMFNEIEFSLLHRSAEPNGLLKCCQELDVTVIAWAPLASGRLTGKHIDMSGESALALLDAMKVIAQARGKTISQVAINWCVCKGVVPIPGARTEAQAIDNAGGVGWRLSADEMVCLDAMAVNRSGMYEDPEAIYAFMGWWPNRFVRPLVSGVIRAGAAIAKWALPLQPKSAE